MPRPSLAAVIVLLLATTAVRGQPDDRPPSVSEACSGPDFRAFDFWLGRWIVRDSTGTRVGSSHISRIARGCGLREEWSGTSGSRGTSLNYYNPADSAWHQDWVGSSGLVLHLTGGKTNQIMELDGTRMTEEGRVRDRIRWRPLANDRVRQEWTVSSDGGRTWKRVFLGFYERAPSDEDG